jgi:hypothetical protein
MKCFFTPVKVGPLRGFAENLQTSLRSARIFRKNPDRLKHFIILPAKYRNTGFKAVNYKQLKNKR